MKKMLRKIIVLVCAATLLAFPVSAAYASTSSVPDLSSNSTSTTRIYTYSPDALDIPAGTAAYLSDNGSIVLPSAGNGLSFSLDVKSGTYRVQVFKVGTGIITNFLASGGPIFFVTPADTSSDTYLVFITAVTDTKIAGYTIYY